LKSIIIGLLVIFLIFIFSCQNTYKTEEMTKNSFIYYTMKDLYLWYDKIPEVDYNKYDSPQKVLDAAMYKKYDKWSFIITLKPSETNYNENEFTGFGFLPFFYKESSGEYSLRIGYVYDYSPASSADLKRTYKITKINSLTIPPNPVETDLTNISAELSKNSIILEYIDSANNTKTTSLTMGKITVKSVLYSNIYNRGIYKIGYIVFNEFIKLSKNELDSVFSNFSNNKVNELIVDLRYNGGGLLDVANYFANYIGGYNADGKIFSTLYYNGRRINNKTTFYFKNSSFDFKRVVFITTGNSASASESLINGLKPHIDVKLVGSKTHGKPVGMLGLPFEDIVFFPIMFRGVNSNNEGDFYDGINVDAEVADDLTKAFGDENEACLKEALYYIQNNNFTNPNQSRINNGQNEEPKNLQIPLEGKRYVFNCF